MRQSRGIKVLKDRGHIDFIGQEVLSRRWLVEQTPQREQGSVIFGDETFNWGWRATDEEGLLRLDRPRQAKGIAGGIVGTITACNRTVIIKISGIGLEPIVATSVSEIIRDIAIPGTHQAGGRVEGVTR